MDYLEDQQSAGSDLPEDRWGEEDSDLFRRLSRYAVPDREHQVAIITALVVAAEGEGGVLDLCCGEGVLSESIRRALPAVHLLAFDGSPSMLQATRARVEAIEGGDEPPSFETRQIDLADAGWRRFEQPLRAVVSSLAVHHLDGPGKRTLFGDLFEALAPGGVFVLADIIEPTTAVGREIAARDWDQEVREQSVHHHGDLRGFEAFQTAEWNHFRARSLDPVDRPSTLTAQIDWLRRAGFRRVDVHWLLAGHAILSGWKIEGGGA